MNSHDLLKKIIELSDLVERLTTIIEKSILKIDAIEELSKLSYDRVLTCFIEISKLEEHKNRQIDENRKSCRRIERLECFAVDMSTRDARLKESSDKYDWDESF